MDAMNFVKYYVHYSDIKSLILVNKEFKDVFIQMKGPALLSLTLRRENMFNKYTIAAIPELKRYETITAFLECIEESRKVSEFKWKVYHPYTFFRYYHF